MTFHNLLVVKLRYLGDVLLATPVMTQLRRAFPEARITMLVNRGTEDMVAGNRDLNDVLILEKEGIAAQAAFCLALRRKGFDCVIDLTDGDRSAFLTWMTKAPVRIGFNQEHRWRGRAYTSIAVPQLNDVHRIERNLSSLRAIGIVPEPGMPVLELSPDDEEAGERILAQWRRDDESFPFVMFQPGARYWFKAWPAERFVELANRLCAATDCRILIGGSPQERELAAAIVSKADPRVISLAGQLPVRHYAAVLKRCALYIGNDAGPMHMAAALGTPVLALFGPSNPAEWGPRGSRVWTIYKGLDCRQCFHPTCERGEMSCMKQISVEEVFQAAISRLHHAAAQRAVTAGEKRREIAPR
jgi:predicted lipopolysaccharide heptosyltransferase III